MSSNSRQAGGDVKTHEQLIPPDNAAVILAAAAVQNTQIKLSQAKWLPTLTMT